MDEQEYSAWGKGSHTFESFCLNTVENLCVVRLCLEKKTSILTI